MARILIKNCQDILHIKNTYNSLKILVFIIFSSLMARFFAKKPSENFTLYEGEGEGDGIY